ncbi:MAG TPA: hypothetical protein VJ276_03230 [Thermoanaerobaculia bacterium]|nr:hypothetical protein [Thermoanaerobaculia bacterium]
MKSLWLLVLLLAATEKPAWQWTDQERIAARVDRAHAQARVQAARSAGDVQAASTMATDGKQVTDVIDGKRNPELFLPTELFEAAINLGLIIPDDWRETWANGAAAAGLPADFWERLPVVAEPFVNDLRRRQDLFELARDADAGERVKYDRQLAALAATLCRDRAMSLAAARKEFGEPLDRFLYLTVAAGKSITWFDEDQDRAYLEQHSRGCR